MLNSPEVAPRVILRRLAAAGVMLQRASQSCSGPFAQERD